jgi:hypothetical protein
MRTDASIQTKLADQNEHLAADFTCDSFPAALKLPGQFSELTRGGCYPDGEHRLMVAVLETALRDYLENAHPRTSEQRARFAEVNHWMNQQSERPRLFTFQWLCDALGIDACLLRKALAALRRRGRSSRRSSIGSASRHYRNVRKITLRPSTSFSTRGRRRSF